MEHASSVVGIVSAVTALLLVAATVLALSKRLRLPFTILLVVTGIALSAAAPYLPEALAPLVRFDLSPELILFVFLPTLIFESSLHLDARQLRRNLLPVLTLAVPGLLISTVIIAFVVSTFTPIDFAAALVLGAILSATDPVAVISLFQQLGAPKRLTILVEGESLFNDATAIVASQILLGIALVGYVTLDTIAQGVGSFLFVFFGGAFVGWLLAVVTGFVLGRVEGDPLIEISLTTVLAYLSFVVAEHGLHVSGVMATVAAALTIGGWGHSKISASVGEYLENFWTYLAFVANALIFLIVGLQIDLAEVASAWPLLIWVIGSMLLARALVIFLLVPLVGRLPGSEAISRKFQMVMYWGGLRGAIALAIVLSLGDFRYAETFIVLVTGAVLFTLIVQGLSIERLIRTLGLHVPPLADRIAESEARLGARRSALAALPDLQRAGAFSARTATTLRTDYQLELDASEEAFDAQRATELGDDQEYNLLLLKCYSVQKAFYHHQLAEGHLSEVTYRNLVYALNVEGDSLRYEGAIPKIPPRSRFSRWWRNTWMRVLQRLRLEGLAESIRSRATVQDYEYAWAGYHGCVRVLASIDELAHRSSADSEVVTRLRALFTRWAQGARRKLDVVSEQFPEFSQASEQRLARRMMLHSQKEFILAQRRSGAIPNSVAAKLLAELDSAIRPIRSYDTSLLKIDPAQFLRDVPVLSSLSDVELPHLLEHLQQRTIPARQDLVREGERGESMFLVARGQLRVLKTEDGEEVEVAQVGAGELIGEGCFLTNVQHSATCRALTPCAVYELKRRDLAELTERCPGFIELLEQELARRG